jgi:hypothetical protein
MKEEKEPTTPRKKRQKDIGPQLLLADWLMGSIHYFLFCALLP